MKRANLLTLTIILFFVAVFQHSCTKSGPELKEPVSGKLVLPEEPYSYRNQQLPPYGPSLHNINNNVATLGRVLFYDKILSANNSVACASCHFQNLAFSDGNALSVGFAGRKTTRNSMAIINPAKENGFFWDMRESSLKSMVSKPVQNHIEMGFDSISNVVGKVNYTSYYKPLFQKAFGAETANEDRIQEALMQFISSMTTYNTKYDEGRKSDFANFTEKELKGKDLFINTLHCNGCHTEPDFTNSWMRGANIGLDENYSDEGMGNGAFKIPSLRNIALTGPYMHDGRFKTLEQVVEHYNSGVKNHSALDWHLLNFDQTGSNGVRRLNLTSFEKDALVAFMKTLTDAKFTTDPKYSNPFMH